MDVTLTIIADEKAHKATAYAVVAPLATTGDKGVIKKAIVLFSIDGKALKPCTTDDAGLATCELANLKNGVHTVIATVLGQTPTVRNEEEFEIGKVATRKPTGIFGLVMMFLFLIILLFFGPGFLLTLSYLVLTFVILKVIARMKRVSVWILFFNNNWVWFSVVGMGILSAIAAHFNPLVPQGLGAGALLSAKKLLGLASKVNLQDSIFWAVQNRLFFGESFTHGWRNAASSYIFIWSTIALFISFTEETIDLIKKLAAHLGKGESLLTFGIKDWLWEHVWKKTGGIK